MKRLVVATMVAVGLGIGFPHKTSAGQFGSVRAYCQTAEGYGPAVRIPASWVGGRCHIFIPGFGVSFGAWFLV